MMKKIFNGLALGCGTGAEIRPGECELGNLL